MDHLEQDQGSMRYILLPIHATVAFTMVNGQISCSLRAVFTLVMVAHSPGLESAAHLVSICPEPLSFRVVVLILEADCNMIALEGP